MTDDGSAGAPVDFDRLELIRNRLAGDNGFAGIDWQPAYAPDQLVFEYDTRLYLNTVQAATLSVVWFENGDLSLHYHEDHETSEFNHRWDRHPSSHNDRDHVHRGPDTPTPGVNVSHPADWRDVLSRVLTEIEERRRAFWRD